MPRPEKVQAVADIKERLENARAVFVAEYAGLSVQQQQELRRGLRDTDAEFKVVKMTLAKRAAAELGYDELVELLVGPTGLAFADEDAVGSAKSLKDFAGDNPALVIKGGVLAGQALTPERISELAELEPREVQLAKIAGAMKAPLTNMAGLLAAMPRTIASMMQQLVEKKESGAAPAGEPDEGDAAEEATATPEEASSTDEAPAAEADAADEPADEAEPAETAETEAEPAETAETEAEPEATTDDDTAADAADDEDDTPADEAEEE